MSCPGQLKKIKKRKNALNVEVYINDTTLEKNQRTAIMIRVINQEISKNRMILLLPSPIVGQRVKGWGIVGAWGAFEEGLGWGMGVGGVEHRRGSWWPVGFQPFQHKTLKNLLPQNP